MVILRRIYILNITNIKNPVTLLNAKDDMNGYEKIDDPIDIEIVKINGFSYIVTTWIKLLKGT